MRILHESRNGPMNLMCVAQELDDAEFIRLLIATTMDDEAGIAP